MILRLAPGVVSLFIAGSLGTVWNSVPLELVVPRPVSPFT